VSPRNIIFLLLVLSSVRGSEPQSLARPESKLKKNFIYLIGSRTRDLPACVVVSPPPSVYKSNYKCLCMGAGRRRSP
jgi:hypothetical protein